MVLFDEDNYLRRFDTAHVLPDWNAQFGFAMNLMKTSK